MTQQEEVSQIKRELIERDNRDNLIDQQNRLELEHAGIPSYQPDKKIILDTGELEGVGTVVGEIVKHIEVTHQIISIDGLSASGKTTTARKLADKMNGTLFSLGEVFRYLTYLYHVRDVSDFVSVLQSLEYQVVDNRLELFDHHNNVSVTMKDKLRSKELESEVPRIAHLIQAEVIQFVAHQLKEIRDAGSRKIIIEGRAFTLDYLPTDLAVTLIADVDIRAKRRWQQRNS